ncbi:hypothetical protein BGX38DRAFT_1142335 [Terfezia claveryi]|nr:hypothetical protein BGX38DRAFT_1142335 [Terfezia claveryi]
MATSALESYDLVGCCEAIGEKMRAAGNYIAIPKTRGQDYSPFYSDYNLHYAGHPFKQSLHPTECEEEALLAQVPHQSRFLYRDIVVLVAFTVGLGGWFNRQKSAKSYLSPSELSVALGRNYNYEPRNSQAAGIATNLWRRSILCHGNVWIWSIQMPEHSTAVLCCTNAT